MTNDPPQPYTYEVNVAAGSGFNGANLITIPGYAHFTQITNEGSTNLTVQLNGRSTSQFNLPANTTQVFNFGDLVVTSIDFSNHISGGGSLCAVQIICGVTTG